MGFIATDPLPDEPVRMIVEFVSGDNKVRVDFGIKHPEEHRRDALPIIQELLTPVERVPVVEVDLCGADMGEGVVCGRPLARLYDPPGWQCGWGHTWTPSHRDDEARRLINPLAVVVH